MAELLELWRDSDGWVTFKRLSDGYTRLWGNWDYANTLDVFSNYLRI